MISYHSLPFSSQQGVFSSETPGSYSLFKQEQHDKMLTWWACSRFLSRSIAYVTMIPVTPSKKNDSAITSMGHL